MTFQNTYRTELKEFTARNGTVAISVSFIDKCFNILISKIRESLLISQKYFLLKTKTNTYWRINLIQGILCTYKDIQLWAVAVRMLSKWNFDLLVLQQAYRRKSKLLSQIDDVLLQLLTHWSTMHSLAHWYFFEMQKYFICWSTMYIYTFFIVLRPFGIFFMKSDTFIQQTYIC